MKKYERVNKIIVSPPPQKKADQINFHIFGTPCNAGLSTKNETSETTVLNMYAVCFLVFMIRRNFRIVYFFTK